MHISPLRIASLIAFRKSFYRSLTMQTPNATTTSAISAALSSSPMAAAVAAMASTTADASAAVTDQPDQPTVDETGEAEGSGEWKTSDGGTGWDAESTTIDAVDLHDSHSGCSSSSSSSSRTEPTVDDVQLEARRVEVQTTNMEEAFNLANSMQAMTYDHRSYLAHFKALCQDLLEAKEGFARKRSVERAQLMTEAQSGMLTIRAMFEDIRGHKVIPTSEEDPLSATLFFEDRVLKSIRFFAREIQIYASSLVSTDKIQWGTRPTPSTAVSSAVAAANDASILSAVRFTPSVSVVGTQNAPPATSTPTITEGMSDEEIARIYQAEEDAAYARLLHQQRAARAGPYRPPHLRDTVAANVPPLPLSNSSSAGGSAAAANTAPVTTTTATATTSTAATTMAATTTTATTASSSVRIGPVRAMIADQEMQAFLDSINSEYPNNATD